MLQGHPGKEGEAQQMASAVRTDLLLSVHMLRSRVRFYLKKWFAAEGKISKPRHRCSGERPGWPLRNEKVKMTVAKPQEINYPKSMHLISSTKCLSLPRELSIFSLLHLLLNARPQLEALPLTTQRTHVQAFRFKLPHPPITRPSSCPTACAPLL